MEKDKVSEIAAHEPLWCNLGSCAVSSWFRPKPPDTRRANALVRRKPVTLFWFPD